MSSSASPPVSPGHPVRTWALRVGAVVAVLVLFAGAATLGGPYVPLLLERVRDAGWAGPVLFVGGYVVATVLGVPGSLLTLSAGALFGLWAGTAWVLVGATLGATAAFLVARHGVRGVVERRVLREPRFAAIDRAIAGNGRRIVFLLRLSPVVPFTLLNYLLGLTKVRLSDFALASVGMIPGTMLYVYTGAVAGEVAAFAGGVAAPRSSATYAVTIMGLFATVAVTIVVTRTARRALQQELARADHPPTTGASA